MSFACRCDAYGTNTSDNGHVSIRDITVPTDEVTTIPIGTISTTGTATEPYFAQVSLVTTPGPCVDLPASLSRDSDDGDT